MRQPKERQLGAQGQEAVKHAFAALGWGVATAPEYEVGTDLFLLARDNRLFDLGLVVGAQVKTGDSFFAEEDRDELGAVTGWWFRDRDREHVDYWLKHALPHLIVLHDPRNGTSNWEHITAESVVSTGQGAKVFVPKGNIVAVEHRDALLAVAATARPPSAWEGSAWTGAGSVAPADLLRHALVVPRLVAPHRNAGIGEAINAEQVVALLVEGRLHEIDRFAEKHPHVLTLAEAARSREWIWGFVAALGERVTTDAVDQLLPFVENAPNPYCRVAATVVAAAALLEKARPDEAIDLIQATLDRDDHGTVDHAWLVVQHARACLEVGQVEEACAQAVQVQQVRLTHAGDVTATAIAGAAALLLFTASDWGSDTRQDAILGQDTTAVWWRSQRVAAGSNAVIDREFTRWTRHSTTVFSGEDVANNRLFTAALLASHLGDHSEWRRLDGLNAKQAILGVERTSDQVRVSNLLAALRRAGDHRSLDRAVRRLTGDGPASAVTAAAAEIDFTHWTHSTCHTNLTLLRRGGDVLDKTTANAAVDWLLAALADTAAFEARTRPTFSVRVQLIDTLSGVVLAAPTSDQRTVAEFVLALPAQQDQLVATSWARVVEALPSSTWTADTTYRATHAAAAHHAVLRLALLGVAATGDEGARHQLLNEIRGRSLDALAEFGDVSRLPDDIASDLITTIESRVTGRIRDAIQGRFGFGGHDVGQALAILNITHPEVARWQPIYALLEEPQVAGSDKRDVCDVLARAADRLTADVRARLAEIAVAMVNQPAAPADRLEGRPSALGPAADLAASLGGDTDLTHTLLARLLSGETDHRCWATRLASRLPPAVATGVLTPLSQDQEPSVRAAAASCLTQVVVDGSYDTLTIAALNQCLEDSGTRVPRNVAVTLAGRPGSTAAVDDIRKKLASHRSAFVRATIADQLQPSAADS